jgi:Rrf2 family iron-sulfur cluster assembly transcriptional regulator
MKITQNSRNAILILKYMQSSCDNKSITIKKISDAIHLPTSTLIQVLNKLKKSNLVSSIKGPGGGYSIQKDTILNLYNIIRSIEGDIAMHKCKGLGNCNNGSKCTMHDILSISSKKIKKTLQQTLLTNSV